MTRDHPRTDVERNDSTIPAGGLTSLEKVNLNDKHSKMLQTAHGNCHGSAVWRYRKLAEVYDLLALSEIASRFNIEHIDAQETLRVLASLEVTVPLRPDTTGRLRV